MAKGGAGAAGRAGPRKGTGSDLGLIEGKIVLLGDSGVGKSSIAQRFCKGVFNDQHGHDVTIGGAYLQ